MSKKKEATGEVSNEGLLSQFESTYVGTALGIAKTEEEGKLILKIYRGVRNGESLSFPFNQDITIGRLETANLCLPHHSVSRLHSKIFWKDGSPWIADLGSTNGTFLNNERVRECFLRDGDRFKIGNAAIKVSFHYDDEITQMRLTRLIAGTEEALKKVTQDPERKDSIVSGSLSHVSLTDILQSIVVSKGEGILVVKGPTIGKIYIRERRIFYAKMSGIEGRKALYRMLSWKKGQFDLRSLDDELATEIPPDKLDKLNREFPGDITHTLLEFLRMQDELEQIAARLPAETDTLHYNPKKPFPKEKDLKRVQQMYDQIQETPLVADLLDAIPLIDMDIYRVLAFFLERGYVLKTAKSPS